MKGYRIIILFFILWSSNSFCQQPVELGNVQWLRDYDEALRQAQNTNQDILILFQEVPGCSTCQRYGSQVLSHPLIVEAIEDAFIPLAIYNNKGGKDKLVLDRYNEPTWNNPVVRIVDKNGDDRVTRISNQYSAFALIQAMIDVKTKRKQEIPPFWKLILEEQKAKQLGQEEIVLSMYCFWTGEKVLGEMDGVQSTEAGFMNGKEVVKVQYVPELIQLEDLIQSASKAKCADQVFTDNPDDKQKAIQILGSDAQQGISSYRKDSEDKYYLLQSDYKYLPLTDLQKTRINSALGRQQNPNIYLSNRQAMLLKSIQNGESKKAKSMIAVPIHEAWNYYF